METVAVRLSERLWEITSRRSAKGCAATPLSSEAMAVKDSGPAKAEEQDRLKALDASIANLEKARGGKPDVAIDEVLRQKRLERQELKDQMQSRKSTKALLNAATAAREKVCHQARGFAEGRDESYAAAVAETTGDFGCEERSRREGVRGRDAAGVWPRSIAKGRFLMSHLLHPVLRPSAVGAWTYGVAPRGRSSQVRGVVQQRRDRGQGVSGSIFGGSEPGVSCYVASSESCLVDTQLRRHLQVPPSVLPRLLSFLNVQRHMLRGFR